MSGPGTWLRSRDGQVIDLDVGRWRGEPCRQEARLLDSVLDPVLDVGCGPGRIVAALGGQGRMAMGIDPAPAAAAEARRRGAAVLCRSVFDPLPGEGRWGTVLLLDGNVGIGGAPRVLLARCRALLQPGGEVVAELGPPGAPSAPLTVRVEVGSSVGPWFDWAVVAADRWADLARGAGLEPAGLEEAEGRWFARARRLHSVS